MDDYENSEYQRDFIQRMFLGIGVLMLLGLPYFKDYLSIEVFAAMLGVVVIGIFAGLTAVRKKWIMFSDILISLIGSFVFEALAMQSYTEDHFMYFIFNQLLSLLFFVTAYLCVKTFFQMKRINN